ncbi:MAG: hypothetical protein RLZZ150_124 [Bacteroidota bacterium]
MTSLVRTLVVIGVALITTFSSSAQDPSFLFPGEELTYRVSYLNITLGTIRTVTEQTTTLNGQKAYKVKVFIDSHPNIPFVSLHSVYESWMDATATYSMQFVANTEVDNKQWEVDKYLFDYSNKKLLMEKYRDSKIVKSRWFDIKKRYNDGSSLLFAARSLLLSKKSLRMPTVIMEDTVNTVVNFNGKQEPVSIDAVQYPIKSVYLNGEANWTGIYGLSGRFEGWFSDDEARIPVKAKMKVYVGSVTIELQKWRRGSWQPPKAS